jgi:hypothetical protein
MRLFKKRDSTTEIEMTLRFKQGLNRIYAYIERLRQSQQRLWELGQRSSGLGDEAQFKNIARGYLAIKAEISRWDRYLITAQTHALKRDQVRMTRDFLGSMSSISHAMMPAAEPEDLLKMQVEIEKALGDTHRLEENLENSFESLEQPTGTADFVTGELLSEVEKAMTNGLPEADERIDEGIRNIQALKKELG